MQNCYCLHFHFFTLFHCPAVLPHITPFEFEHETNTGDSVQLNCYISKGDTPLKITWKLNGNSILPHFGISTIPIGDRTSLLTIAAVQPEHAGNYSCVASNRAGQVSRNATLFINGTNSRKTVLVVFVICFFNFVFHQPFSTTPNNAL